MVGSVCIWPTKALQGPLLGATCWGREESKVLASELPSFAHQLLDSFWETPVHPLNLSCPFPERRQFSRCLLIC